MSIVFIMFKCDWPGCTRQVTCPESNLDDYDWERRHLVNDVAQYHVCPEHLSKSTIDLLKALDKAETE